MAAPFNPGSMTIYRGLGIDYVVLQSKHRLSGVTPLFENESYAVYQAP
jgi:hypothetical protein